MTNVTPVLYDNAAEQALIGAVIADGKLYNRVQYITPDMFMIIVHREIWRAIMALVKRDIAVDILTVNQRLNDSGVLNEGGALAAYTKDIGLLLAQVPAKAPKLAHVEDYAKRVHAFHMRRSIAAQADSVKELALNNDLDAGDLISEWHKAGAALRDPSKKARTIGDVAMDRMQRAEYLYEHRDVLPGVPTGLTELDAITSGMHPTDLIVLAGRPAMGKSALMMTLVYNQLRDGKRVGVFSLEMSSEQLVDRLVAMDAQINLQAVRNPQLLTPDQWKRYVKSMGNVDRWKHNLLVDDSTGQTPGSIRATALSWQDDGKLDAVYMDYAQKMRSESKQESRTIEVGYFARSIKDLARELSEPVVMLSQLSRALEQRADKRPMLSDLRESGEIEQEADIVWFLYRDVVYHEMTDDPNGAEIIVAKHRNGAIGTARCIFEGQYTRFINGSRRQIRLGGTGDNVHTTTS